jgi:AraC-like DNA-binding protein
MSRPLQSTRVETLIRFIKKRGFSQARLLIQQGEQGVPLATTALALGLTRQRVRRLRRTFGETRKIYVIDPVIQKILDEEPKRS